MTAPNLPGASADSPAGGPPLLIQAASASPIASEREKPGDDENWAFAIYDPATETYADAILRTSERAGHPNDAFDTAAIIHLPDYQQ